MPAVKRKILDLSPELVAALPAVCRSCCFWESTGPGTPGECDGKWSKEAWVRGNLDEGFAPGKLIRSESETLAYVQFQGCARGTVVGSGLE